MEQLGNVERVEISVRPKGGGTPWATLRTPPIENGTIDLPEGETSVAKFSIPERGQLASSVIDQISDLQELIVPWATEVAVAVNGVELVTGPVVDIQGDLVEVHDFSAWWARRDTQGHQIESDDPVRIFRTVHDAGMAEDDSPNFAVQPFNSGLVWSFQSDPLDYTKLSDSLQTFRDAGVSWFARGRNIYVRGPRTAEPVGTFEDRHFAGRPIRHHAGKTQANSIRMIGSNSGEGGPYMTVEESRSSINRVGLLRRTFRDSKLDSETAVIQAAKTRLANLEYPVRLTMPAPAQFSRRAPLSFSTLIPGSVYNVTSVIAGSAISGLFRVERFSVSFDGSVSASFQPVSEDNEL